MKLGVRDAAGLLSVSEKTIYRWIAQGKLPAYRVSDQYRFNRAELLEWATARRIPVSPGLLLDDDGVPPPALHEAIRSGGVFYRLSGRDKPSVLRSVVDIMPLPDEVDREFLLAVLLARETMGSTGVGDGIAIPHVRNPIVMHIPRPMVSVCFLEHPIDFAAIDRKPVHTLFSIVSPTVKAHLSLLSRLAFALRQPAFVAAVRDHALREEIFRQAEIVDGQLRDPRPCDGAKSGRAPARPAKVRS